MFFITAFFWYTAFLHLNHYCLYPSCFFPMLPFATLPIYPYTDWTHRPTWTTHDASLCIHGQRQEQHRDILLAWNHGDENVDVEGLEVHSTSQWRLLCSLLVESQPCLRRFLRSSDGNGKQRVISRHRTVWTIHQRTHTNELWANPGSECFHINLHHTHGKFDFFSYYLRKA